MELELLSKKVSILAKELGFYYPVSRYYLENEEKEAYHSYVGGKGNFNIKEGNYISAPEQELLAKWLRDVHDILISTIRASRNNEKGITYYINGVLSKTWGVWPTYEEAIEEALKEALNTLKQKLANDKENS